MARETDDERQRRRDPANAVTGLAVRLLPWPTDDGRPCYLRTDDAGGYLSRLADEMEAVQLSMGAEVLDHAREVLGNPKASAAELRYTTVHLGGCLSDALRVAESRGMRLPVPPPDTVEDEEDGREGPSLPTKADG